jgi:hypothetical protein
MGAEERALVSATATADRARRVAQAQADFEKFTALKNAPVAEPWVLSTGVVTAFSHKDMTTEGV